MCLLYGCKKIYQQLSVPQCSGCKLTNSDNNDNEDHNCSNSKPPLHVANAHLSLDFPCAGPKSWWTSFKFSCLIFEGLYVLSALCSVEDVLFHDTNSLVNFLKAAKYQQPSFCNPRKSALFGWEHIIWLDSILVFQSTRKGQTHPVKVDCLTQESLITKCKPHNRSHGDLDFTKNGWANSRFGKK